MDGTPEPGARTLGAQVRPHRALRAPPGAISGSPPLPSGTRRRILSSWARAVARATRRPATSSRSAGSRWARVTSCTYRSKTLSEIAPPWTRGRTRAGRSWFPTRPTARRTPRHRPRPRPDNRGGVSVERNRAQLSLHPARRPAILRGVAPTSPFRARAGSFLTDPRKHSKRSEGDHLARLPRRLER